MKTHKEHLITVQINLDVDTTEALRLAFPSGNVIGLILLAELLGTALDVRGIEHSTGGDHTELNMGNVMLNVDRLGEALTVIEETLGKVALLPVATISYVDARESSEVAMHWRKHYPRDGGGIDLNELMTPELRARKAQAVSHRNEALKRAADELRRNSGGARQ